MDGLSVSNGGAPAVDTISVAEKSLLQKVLWMKRLGNRMTNPYPGDQEEFGGEQE